VAVRLQVTQKKEERQEIPFELFDKGLSCQENHFFQRCSKLCLPLVASITPKARHQVKLEKEEQTLIGS